jgi:hypothetical protein
LNEDHVIFENQATFYGNQNASYATKLVKFYTSTDATSKDIVG